MLPNHPPRQPGKGHRGIPQPGALMTRYNVRDIRGRFIRRDARDWYLYPVRRDEAVRAVAIQTRNRTPRPASQPESVSERWPDLDPFDFAALL